MCKLVINELLRQVETGVTPLSLQHVLPFPTAVNNTSLSTAHLTITITTTQRSRAVSPFPLPPTTSPTMSPASPTATSAIEGPTRYVIFVFLLFLFFYIKVMFFPFLSSFILYLKCISFILTVSLTNHMVFHMHVVAHSAEQ
jgi:hypothetical protein